MTKRHANRAAGPKARAKNKENIKKIFVLCNFIIISIVILILSKPRVYNIKNKEFKYILYWNQKNLALNPRWRVDVDPEVFFIKNCTVQNCITIDDQTYFEDVSTFDAIVFHAPLLTEYKDFPTKRKPEQIYIFASIESDHNYPLCSLELNGYFNWTWTFRIDSDIPLKYLIIRDKAGKLIGPGNEMNWLDTSKIRRTVLSENVNIKLQNKRKVAAWMASYCKTESKRENTVKQLQQELYKYNLSIDVFGECGNKKCPKENMKDCLKMIERKYYFYLAFENSFGKDYVSEKLLNALKSYTVPVVFGSANYTLFIPDGFYLDSWKLGGVELARKMNEMMQDREKYNQYFKWRNFYSYHDPEESSETDPLCQLCAKLNDKNFNRNIKVYDNFNQWWDVNRRCSKTVHRRSIAVNG